MAISDLIFSSTPEVCYLYPAATGPTSTNFQGPTGSDGLTFQYWPTTLQDDYQVEYAEHQIPGGSHPLYQWVGGRGRTITFQAVFTAEINQTKLGQGFGIAPRLLTPSQRFTVNVNGALDKIRSWMRPEYTTGDVGRAKAPKILTLIFPQTSFNGGGGTKSDGISVILKSAPITYEAWFSNGEPRIATVDLQFSEIVQEGSSQGKSTSINFKDRTDFESSGGSYDYKGLNNRPLLGSLSL